MVRITAHIFEAGGCYFAWGFRECEDAQTWHLQQHTLVIGIALSVLTVRRTNSSIVTRLTRRADVCGFDSDTCQGATLGIILCLDGYFVLYHEALKRREAICRHQHIKHDAHKHKIQVEAHKQLYNHCSLVSCAHTHTDHKKRSADSCVIILLVSISYTHRYRCGVKGVSQLCDVFCGWRGMKRTVVSLHNKSHIYS